MGKNTDKKGEKLQKRPRMKDWVAEQGAKAEGRRKAGTLRAGARVGGAQTCVHHSSHWPVGWGGVKGLPLGPADPAAAMLQDHQGERSQGPVH